MDTVVLQGETITIIDAAATNTVFRTQNGTDEDNANGNNTGPGKQYDTFGLWRGYLSDGYLDINGSGTGAKASFTVETPDVAAGTTETIAVTLRIANGSSSARPIALSVDGVATAPQDADTDPREWDHWENRTFTIDVTGPGPHTVEIVQSSTAGAPNIDAIAIHDVGAAVNFAAPTITSAATFVIEEGNTAVDTVTATDLDGADVTFSLAETGDHALFALDSLSGALSFLTAPDVAADTDYTVTVIASDGEKTSEQTLTVTVTNAVPKPQIDPIVLQGEDAIIPDGAETFARDQADIMAGDPVARANGDLADQEDAPGTLKSNEPLDEFGLRDEYSGYGYLDFGGAGNGFAGDEKISWTVDVTEGGLYDLHIRYAGTGGSDLRPLDIIVNGTTQIASQEFPGSGFENWDVEVVQVELSVGPNTLTLAIPSGLSNGPNIDAVALTTVGASVVWPATNVAPVFDGAPTTFDATEGMSAAESFAATDANAGDTLSYSLQNAAAGFSIDPASGALTFAAPAYDDAGSNTYTATVVVSDGILETSTNVTATVVESANEAPTAASTAASGTEDTPLDIDVADLVADDTDADADLTITAEATNGTVVVSGTTITFTPAADFNGDATITYRAQDLGGASSSDATIAVTVAAVNDAPTLTGDPIVEIVPAAGGTVSLASLTAADVDGPAPTFAVALAGGGDLPDGVEIDGNGDLTIPEGLDAGDLTLEVFATDGELASQSVAVTVTVEDAPDLSYAVPTTGELVIQLENRDGSIVINDDSIGDGEGDPDATQFRDLTNTESVSAERPQGLWPGFNGDGYLDMGGQVGDQATFDVTVEEPSDYTFTFRYGNGSGSQPVRPLDIAVDGVVQATPDFDRGTNDQGQPSGWTDWQDEVVTLTLPAGTSTISITNTVNNGPNIDQVTITPPAPVDEDPTALTVTPLDPQPAENVLGAEVATVVVSDVDTVYAATDLQLTDPSGLFELVATDVDNSFTLKLKDVEALDFEAETQPTVTVALGALSDDFTAAPLNDDSDDGGPLAVTFEGPLASYSGQDRPGDGGAGAVVGDSDASLTLDGNLWKRVPLATAYDITENSKLTVTIEIGEVVPEIVAIGFDDDDKPFEQDKTVYQIAGTQTQGNFVDLRGQGTDNGNGTVTFVIDLAAQAGASHSSMVLVSDDDIAGNGLGSVTFSGVEIYEDDGADTNAAPRVVGGGVADFAIDEGETLEIDLPFIDDDGDDLQFTFEIIDDSTGQPVVVAGLTAAGGVLSGPAPTAVGSYTVTVTANDGSAQTSDTFTLTVNNLNEAPEAADVALEPYFGMAGQPFSGIDLQEFAAIFTDPDDDALTLTAEGLPAGLSVNDEGVIEGTPTEGGTFDVTIRATDAGGLSDTITIALTIEGIDPGDVVVVEAEDLSGLAGATNFQATGLAGASDAQIIYAPNSASASSLSTELSQNGLVSGYYTVAMTGYDETDGDATFSLVIGDTVLADNATWASLDQSGLTTFDYPTNARGGAGQKGNIKTVTFSETVFVDADTVMTLSGQRDGELLRTDKFTFTRVDAPNEAPITIALATATVAENAAAATIGTLSATDPDGDDGAITFEVVGDSKFEVAADGTTLKLKDGEAFDFETDGASVDVTVEATDADGATSQATLAVTVTDVDEAPSAVTLTNDTVAENADGEVVGTLQSLDPELTAVSFTVDDARFEVDGDDQLTLKTGESLDFETEPTVTLNVTATDGTGEVTVTPLTVTVTNANDAPELPVAAALDDVTLAAATGGTVDLSALGATDADGDTLSYAIAGEAALAAGFAVEADGTTLTIPASAPAGSYEVSVFATDGQADSESVSFTVTVGEPAAFETIIIQGEAFTDLGDGNTDDSDDNLIRTQTQNQEKDGLNGLGADVPGGNTSNPGLPDFDDYGLRPDYSGVGYLDINGTDTGAQATATFDAPAGSYSLTIRYANGSSNNRPMTFDIDGTQVEVADTKTGEWYQWQTVTLPITIAAAGTHTLTILQDVSAGAANIDAVAIHEVGTTVDFFSGTTTDESADEDGNLAAAPVAASVALADADAVTFNLTGIDADIETIEVAVDGGDFVAASVTGTGEDRVVTVDLSAFGAGSTVGVALRVTDEAGNTETRATTVAIESEVVTFDPVTIQGEDATITDVPGTGTGNEIVALLDGETDAFGNTLGDVRTGYLGDPGGYLDYGNTPGDTAAFTITVPADGVYTATFRYANGDDAARPLDLTVNGNAALQVPFAPTVAPGNGDDWNAWTEVTVELNLSAGGNTIALTIPTAANGGVDNGPNIDQVTFALKEADTGGGTDVSEPGPRETILINFQDGSAPKADGYLVANFEGFAQQAGGLSYGFVTEASAIDADGTQATPIDGGNFPAVAINERSGNESLPNDGSLPADMTGTIDVSGYDPRLLGYAHTDLPGYNGQRVAFELALENGWYEVTVAVGDTAGPNDSNNSLRIEGEVVAEWTPTAAFKTELVTAVVEVEDGFLTLDGRDGSVTEFQYLEVRELPDLTPGDDREAPEDYASFVNPVALSENDSQPLGVGSGGALPVDINPTADIVVGIDVVDGRGGVLLESLNDGSVKLIETLTGEEVAIRSQTTGGFDSLTIAPDVDLKEYTSYTLIIDGFRDRGDNEDFDAPTREFQKFTTTFVTGEAPEVVDREVAFTENVEVDGFADGGIALTSVEMSPDGSKLYASSLGGTITRWDVGSDGSLSNAQVLSLDYFTATNRGIIGLTFDPLDPNVLWVTDNHEIPLSGRDNGVPDFSGQVTKITLGTGTDFTGTAETYVTGLPRSNGDHVTNSLEFRPNPAFTPGGDDPEYLLYLTQGSNSAMGEADSAWGFRPERLLNAAVLEIDPTRTDVPNGGFDVTTEPLPADGNNRRFDDPDGDLFNGGIAIDSGQYTGNFLHFNEQGVASVRTGADASSSLVAEFYDPFADDAPLKVFATGARNPYDLVWHSNGYLYVPTNGSAAGGNVPDDPDTAQNEGFNGVEKQDDYLFIIPEEGGTYSGHPNPLHKQYILNGGNPTGGNDPNQVNKYPVGIDPDPDYDPDYAYSVSENRSPNGAIEYLSNSFGSSLQNAVIFTQYSSGDNLRAILVDPTTGLPTDDFILRNTDGDIISYTDPLDVIEGADGRLYMLTLNRSNGQSQIVRLDPEGTVIVDNTADEGNDLELVVVDASNPAAVVFEVSGLDSDIETITVSFGGGQPQAVTLDGNGQFTADVGASAGTVAATLTVGDKANNTAFDTTTVNLDGGGQGGPVFVDATEFRVLSALTGTQATVIRNINDPSTHETTDSNDLNDDGLNDGYDGLAYLDPNGGSEDKAEFTFDAPVAGTYTFSFRMAANNDRAVTFLVGDQAETVTVNTTSFTNWADYDVVLAMVEGDNIITINQPGNTGPNIDSVTITPLDVVDGTADEFGDLDLVAGDLSDPQAAAFTISGADSDLVSASVVFTDADSNTVTETLTADGDFNGTFTVDLSTLSGAFTATLTVSDGTNSETETANFTLDDGDVPNDGTEIVDNLLFEIYEAENADLDGPVVVTEDRTQSGDFVDFDGTTDQTVTWTVSVPQDGEYRVDILYALASGKAARPMSLSVDGSVVETLPFAPNSNADETIWTPQTTSLDLTAGTHTIAVTAPVANGPNVDYLRITSQPLGEPLDLTADENDDLTLTVFDQSDASAVVFQVAGLDDDIETLTVAFNGGPEIDVTLDGNDQFTADAGTTLGTVDAVLTVTDDASNTATAGASFSVAPDGNPNADVEVQSLDPVFFDSRLHFSWVENSDGRDFKETASFEIFNTGSETLDILSAEISEFYSFAQGSDPVGLSIAAGDSVTIDVDFDGSTDGPDGFNARSSGVNGVYEGTLTLVTNDADSPIVSLDLAAFWQPAQEGGNEPNVNEVWQVLGFGNEIANLPFTGGGQDAILDFDDLYLPAPGQEGIEVLSPYWRIAEGVETATATMIAAFNASGSAGLGLHNPGNKGQDINLTSWSPNAQSQTLFPLQNGQFATATFDIDDIPGGWAGNGIFGIEMAGLSTDPTLNPSGNGTPSQSALNANYGAGTYTVTGTGANAVVTDAEGNVVEDGYTVRMFQALDADGNPIEHVYLGIMDYTGINYDYNDNMFLFEGITPVGTGGVLTVSGLDDAAADDRLVFTNIENPNNAGGLPQNFRNEATFTITNDGIGDLAITGLTLAGADASAFQIVSGPTGGTTLGAGQSVAVTVEFVGTDGVDDNAAVLYNDATLAVATTTETQTIALAGLAQLQSESGEEPSVAQIVQALGYGTDVAQSQLNAGGVVETVGDEVLTPYLQAANGSQVEVIDVAAFLTQGNISRLNKHDVGNAALIELYAADDQQGQTVLPDGLVPGAGDTGSVARATLDGSEPFGLKITVDGRANFAAWTDPDANLEDPAFNLGPNNEGHYLRFFQAKDAAGTIIPNTLIAIQDYPGGENFDYNDHMFVIKNVTAYDPAGAEDDDSNGVVDTLETDSDNDGLVDFFDGDTTQPSDQAPFGGTAPTLGNSLTVAADTFDTGGQGVAWNDDPGKNGGDATRTDSDVEIIGGDVAFVETGEWVEYTIDVAETATYDIAFVAKAPTDGATISVSVEDGPALATVTLPDANAAGNNSFTGTEFGPTDSAQIALDAGLQTLRLTFGGTVASNGYVLDLRSFTLTAAQTGGGNSAPTTGGITGAPLASEGEAYTFDVSGFFADADPGDTLTFSASGLPSGLAISSVGVISGTPGAVAADTIANVTVTASDGQAGVASSFDLTVQDVAAPVGQAPFPGPNAPAVSAGTLTVAAQNYDDGGQGVAYNDAAGLQGGSNGGRTGSDVEVTGAGDIGWIEDGEWYEYTIDVGSAGTYDLDLQLSFGSTGARSVTAEFFAAGETTPYASTGPIANPNTGGWTTFLERSSDGIDLEAGEQVVRFTFNGGSQDFRSFTLTEQETDGGGGDGGGVVTPPTIQGTEGNDAFSGTAASEVLLGLGGNDRLFGLAGNDTLDGGVGDDALFGGDGDDVLIAGAGRDGLNGNEGSDFFVITDDAFWPGIQDFQDGLDTIVFAGDAVSDYSDLVIQGLNDTLTMIRYDTGRVFVRTNVNAFDETDFIFTTGDDDAFV